MTQTARPNPIPGRYRRVTPALMVNAGIRALEFYAEVFGATDYDLVQYVSYRDRLGLITANATTPYILNFIDLGRTSPLVVELPPGPTASAAHGW